MSFCTALSSFFFSLFDLISKSFILLDRLLDRLNNFRSIALQLAIFHCIGISMFLDLHSNGLFFLNPFRLFLVMVLSCDACLEFLFLSFFFGGGKGCRLLVF